MRKVLWANQRMGLACAWCEDKHIHICIRSVMAEPRGPSCSSPALLIAFHDLDDLAPAEFHGGLFTDAQATQIVEFVKGNDPDATILINCEAGVSRSSAVAASLSKFFNGDDNEVFKHSVPNMFVFRKMLKALEIDSTSTYEQKEKEDWFGKSRP